MRITDDYLKIDDYVKHGNAYPKDVDKFFFFKDGKISYFTKDNKIGLLNADGSTLMDPVLIKEHTNLMNPFSFNDFFIRSTGEFGRKDHDPNVFKYFFAATERSKNGRPIGGLEIRKLCNGEIRTVCKIPPEALISLPLSNISIGDKVRYSQPLDGFKIRKLTDDLFFISRLNKRKLVYDSSSGKTVFNSKSLTHNLSMDSVMTDTHWVITGVGKDKGRIVSIPIADIFCKSEISQGIFKRKNKFFKIKDEQINNLGEGAVLKTSQMKPFFIYGESKPIELVEELSEKEGLIIFPNGTKYSKKLLSKTLKF